MSAAGGMGGWMGDLEGSVDEVLQSALGLPAMEVSARHEAPPSLYGAYLGLVGPAGAVQIGLASSADGCQALAKGLLGMEPGGDPLPDAEMADAVCEIVNIVAGAFKTRVRDRAHPLQMGLPVFIHGAVHSTEHTAVRVAEVKVGSIPAAVLLVHPRDSHGS